MIPAVIPACIALYLVAAASRSSGARPCFLRFSFSRDIRSLVRNSSH